jgi:DNA polymerase-3 subunit delta'
MPWQEDLWEQALGALEAGRQHHALLIEGLPGSGRGAFADALARRVLCASPDRRHHCGSCKACELAAAGSHPDYLKVLPEEEGKAIGIDAIRGATGFINATASQSARKVLLIQPAERLTTAASNAFLKSLEEPAAGTLVLLVAARGQPLPATIRSRCQRISLSDPAPAVSIAWLKEHMQETTKRSAEQLLELFPARPLAALAHSASEELELLIELHEFFERQAAGAMNDASRSSLYRLQVERIASGLEPDTLLDAGEQLLAGWLREQRGADLNSERARRAFAGMDAIAILRRARRSGQNPNTDLLRSRAVGAMMSPFVTADAGGHA